ncbi:MAG: bifunctional nuclease family protein [Bacillota bacterium]|nr:bifunctional nuclease family protein [Bacillota bacterium]MDW7730160.1 bifunctional nuclease family protein [Bacillota bacterium]
MIKMEVKTVTADQGGNFLILLMDDEEKKVLPISIGPLEAQSIALVLQGEVPPRPMTHDLLKTLCENLGGMIQKIVITDIRESTFYAELYLEHNGETLIIDSRPSDAIALALRCEAPIYMETRLIEFTYDFQDIIAREGGDEELH